MRAFFDRPTGHRAYLEKRFGVEVRARIVRNLLGEVAGLRILDVGCGDGTLSLQYAGNGNHLTLIDLSREMLEAARRRTPVRLQAEVEYLNMDFMTHTSDKPYDVVLCIGVLAHMQSPERLMGRVSSALRPGGRCLVQLTDPNSVVARIDHLYSMAHRLLGGNRYHYSLRRVSFADLRRVCLQSGFEVAGQRRYSLLLPGMGRLPDQFLVRYQLHTVESHWLSRHGSEVIMLLSKT